MLNHQQKEILSFIFKILSDNNIEFQITGGLAAICYGATRPLYDIDIDIYKKDKNLISELFVGYIIEDWNNDLEGDEDQFDVWVLKLKIKDVFIDISQVEDFRIKNVNGTWIDQPENLNYQMIIFEDIELPVQKKEDLIKYKKLIARDTDLIDIQSIS